MSKLFVNIDIIYRVEVLLADVVIFFFFLLVVWDLISGPTP
jgi:hypothetical protein